MLLNTIAYDIDDQGFIVDRAFQNIEELNVYDNIVGEGMKNIRENPVNSTSNHTEHEGETLREIAFHIINFIDHELMKLDFDK